MTQIICGKAKWEASDINTHSGECPHGNITQTVEHVLLNCMHSDINDCKHFIEKYIQYSTSSKDRYQACKIEEIKNFNPPCPSNVKAEAVKQYVSM